MTEEQFARIMTVLDRKLGAWQSSEEPSWNVTTRTNGSFVRLTYQSRFAKGMAIEQFSWRIENGKLALLGYHVNSPLPLTEE